MGFLDRLLGRTKEAGRDVTETVGNAADKAEDVAGDVVDKAEDVADDAMDKAEDVADDVKDRVTGSDEPQPPPSSTT
jgi:hypothetical protein